MVVWQLNLAWIMQQDNPKHNNKMAEKEKINMLQRPSQSPGCNLTEMLWQDLNRGVYKQMPANLKKLKQSFREEWPRIPPQWYEKLIRSYKNDYIKYFLLSSTNYSVVACSFSQDYTEVCEK